MHVHPIFRLRWVPVAALVTAGVLSAAIPGTAKAFTAVAGTGGPVDRIQPRAATAAAAPSNAAASGGPMSFQKAASMVLHLSLRG